MGRMTLYLGADFKSVAKRKASQHTPAEDLACQRFLGISQRAVGKTPGRFWGKSWLRLGMWGHYM